ncbi:MAG: molybdopterin molybdotransferase MoeA [Lactobacillus sp.]|nr:molybdopterin molybdotransferase MoeA [Lactobacillus sp.]
MSLVKRPPLVPVESAQNILKQHVPIQSQSETIPLLAAQGRVLAQAIYAQTPVPNFARSGMDGYAVRSADLIGATKATPVTLKVLGHVYPGEDPSTFFGQPQTAVRVLTGSPIPAGFDGVVKQEWTDLNPKAVAVFHEIDPQTNYGAVGEDIPQGQQVLAKHSYLNYESLGILASLGLTDVTVLRPLRVGLIFTGSGIQTPGTPLNPGSIYNSLMYPLVTYIQSHGGVVVFKEYSDTSSHNFANIIRQYGPQVDLIITTGGVSVGDQDIVPKALAALRAKILFQGVAMKPGTPVLASLWQGHLILSLSGNLFAALVNFHLFYWPLLAQFFDNDQFALKQQMTTLTTGSMAPSKLRRFVRGQSQASGVAITAKSHHASVLSDLINNDCLIIQPKNTQLQVGDQVQILTWPR